MRTWLIAIVCLPGLANAGGLDRDTTESNLSGPYDSVEAYCRYRKSLRDEDPRTRGAVCNLEPQHGFVRDDMPADRDHGAFRGVRFILLGRSWHAVMRTSTGWFGKRIDSEAFGSHVGFGNVAFRDLVRDRRDELYFEYETYSDNCSGCGDPSTRERFAIVCVEDEGLVDCTDRLWKGAHIRDGARESRWRAEWKITRSGIVTPTLRDVAGVEKRELRSISRPFRLRFL